METQTQDQPANVASPETKGGSTATIGSPPTPPPVPRMTVADVLRKIPKKWHDAEIAVGDSIGRAISVKRVSLHKNDNGRKVVVLHDNRINQ